MIKEISRNRLKRSGGKPKAESEKENADSAGARPSEQSTPPDES